jgi:hypothetical protein
MTGSGVTHRFRTSKNGGLRFANPPYEEGRAPSNQRRGDDGTHLRHVLDAPEQAQQIVDAAGVEVLFRHQPELLFHFGICHRIPEVAAVIFHPDGLARARFQNDFQFAQVEFLFGPVGFIGRQAFDAADEVEQVLIVQIGVFVIFGLDLAVHQHQARRIGNAVMFHASAAAICPARRP